MRTREWYSTVVYVDSSGSRQLTEKLNELQKEWDIIEEIIRLSEYYILIVVRR